MAAVVIQSVVFQISTVSWSLSDELIYEGMQACVDDPSENDDPASLASLPSRHGEPLVSPITTYSLLSGLASIQNTHQLLALRC